MDTPDEIAAFALALASDDFPYTTGSRIVIDSGKTAHALAESTFVSNWATFAGYRLKSA
jgi:hypothetical protein